MRHMLMPRSPCSAKDKQPLTVIKLLSMIFVNCPIRTKYSQTYFSY